MIRITRINHEPLVLNSDLIEHIETTPDTVISLTTGQKFMVLESPEQVIERVIRFRRSISNCFFRDKPAAATGSAKTTPDRNTGEEEDPIG